MSTTVAFPPKSHPRSHLLGAAAVALILAVLLLWPLWNVAAAGVVDEQGSFTLDFLRLIVQSPPLVAGLLRALGIAACTTAAAVAIGLPLAIWATGFDFPGRKLLSALLLLPLVMPTFVGAVGMRALLARFGPLSMLFFGDAEMGVDWVTSLRLVGVVAVEALSLYPIVFLNLQASLANVDPMLSRAAANLGIRSASSFFRVTLPLIFPGLFAGATLVFIWSFTELGTPLMFQVYDVTPVQIFTLLSDPESSLPYALVLLMLVTSVGLYAVGRFLLGRARFARGLRASKGSSHRVAVAVDGVRGWLLTGAFSTVLISAALPHVAVLLTSVSRTGQWYRSLLPRELTLAHYAAALSDEIVMPSLGAGGVRLGAVGNSIAYATAATAIGVTLALSIALITTRSRLRIRGLIDAASMIPLAVPGVVMAFGYLAASVRLKRALGPAMPVWLDVQQWPVLVLVFAYAIRRLPYAVRSVVAGLQQVPLDFERAGANLGLGARSVLRRIVLPLVTANVVAGGLLAFVLSMLEVSDSLVLAQGEAFFPITKAIWELSQRLGDGPHVASALGAWAMGLLALTLVLASSLLGKRLGAMFRAS